LDTHMFSGRGPEMAHSLSLVMDHFTFHTPVDATWVAMKAHMCKHT